VRAERYESLTEPLARMAGVLGRWGDDKEFDVVMDVLRGLHQQGTKVLGGYTTWLNLRLYPAVLVFTAYGIGLTKAGRWATLYRLFSSTLHVTGSSDAVRVVDALFLWSWSGGGDTWKMIEGLDRRKTPLSDHLLDVMGQWRKSFVGVDAAFELLCERFEMLGALASLGKAGEAELEQQLATQGHMNFVWMPLGRVGWDSQVHRQLVQELKSDACSAELLRGGFARNSRKFLNLFIQNFNRVAGSMR